MNSRAVEMDQRDEAMLQKVYDWSVVGPEGGVFARSHDWMTADLLARGTDWTTAQVARSLARLAGRGLLERRRYSATAGYRAMSLPPETEAHIGQPVPGATR